MSAQASKSFLTRVFVLCLPVRALGFTLFRFEGVKFKVKDLRFEGQGLRSRVLGF